MIKTNPPKYLFRDSDGERYSLNEDGETYSMDSSMMYDKYKYKFELLMYYGFKFRLDECNIVKDTLRYEGCGEIE